MTAVLVDANVLIDIMTEDPEWSAWSSAALQRAADTSRLVINAIIYADVSVRFSRIEDVEAALPADMIAREPIPFMAGFLAAKAFRVYRRRGGTKLLSLPDFFIGAHAAVAGYRLLTRDATRYRTYFPTVRMISPA